MAEADDLSGWMASCCRTRAAKPRSHKSLEDLETQLANNGAPLATAKPPAVPPPAFAEGGMVDPGEMRSAIYRQFSHNIPGVNETPAAAVAPPAEKTAAASAPASASAASLAAAPPPATAIPAVVAVAPSGKAMPPPVNVAAPPVHLVQRTVQKWSAAERER